MASKLAVQMYTVRDHTHTEQDFIDSLGKIQRALMRKRLEAGAYRETTDAVADLEAVCFELRKHISGNVDGIVARLG